MARNKLKETTFPSLNQTGESCSLSLNLASSLACVCRPPPPNINLVDDERQKKMVRAPEYVSKKKRAPPYTYFKFFV